MLNKQQAAEFLGVNVRTLERYTQSGKIGSRYKKGKNCSRFPPGLCAVTVSSFQMQGLSSPGREPESGDKSLGRLVSAKGGTLIGIEPRSVQNSARRV